ncbi:MAG: pyridoxal-dependent decarboxylase [Burkholderiales bacterium]|nr:pyridoxal-dependent decarboxylase [Burkholderiales bacterium]
MNAPTHPATRCASGPAAAHTSDVSPLPPAAWPTHATLRAVAHRLVDAICDAQDAVSYAPPLRTIPDRERATLQTRGIPDTGRDPLEAATELLRIVETGAARANHPRAFAFIPGPHSAVSWLGDLVTSGLNPHAGSWLQSSGAAAIELEVLRWLAARFGLPATTAGVFTSGGSLANLTALQVARDRRLAQRDRAQAVAYCSDQCHSSVAKALGVLGFAPEQLRRLPVDAAFRLDPAALARAVDADRAAGRHPWVVVANAGSTNTGSIDPLDAIADIASTRGLWLHADGAYGAAAALVPARRAAFAGLARVDSLTFDPHKWAFQTYGCACVLVRDGADLTRTFHTRPEYLRDTDTTDHAPNFWDRGIELTRPARALRFWLTLQTLGADGLARAIAHGIALGEAAAAALARTPYVECLSGPQLGIVCFRFVPPGVDDAAALDALQSRVARAVTDDGTAFVLTTVLRGQVCLRLCAISPQAGAGDVETTIARLARYAGVSPVSPVSMRST